MREWIDRVGQIADGPDDSAEDRLKHRFLIATGLVMSVGGILWGVVALALGATYLSAIPFGYVLLTALNFATLKKTKNFAAARNIQILLSIVLPFALQWGLGGILASGGTMLWSMLCLSAAQSFEDRATSQRWLFLFLCLTSAPVGQI